MLSELISGRAYPADAARLLKLYEAVDIDEIGYIDVSFADIDSMLRDPRAVLDKSVLLTRADDVPVAVMVPSRTSGDQHRIDLELIVEPGRRELFDHLVASAELEWSKTEPPSALELWVAAPLARDLLQQRGFTSSATFVRYSRDLSGSEQRPAARPDARVRPVADESEWPLFHALLLQVFSDSPEPVDESYGDWALRMRSADVNDPSQWWLLEVQEPDGRWDAVGVLQGNRQDSEENGAWIKNLGLAPEFRGRGLGRYLLSWGLAEFAAAGLKRVGLGADLANVTHALALYDTAGFERRYTATRFSKQL